MTADIHALAGEFIAHGGADQWEALSMVLTFDGGELDGTYGFAYGADGSITATSARPSRVGPLAVRVAESATGDPVLPVSMLVQVERSSGRCRVVVEPTDTSRWQVTPQNLAAIRQELRPTFG
ncbi:MAG: hypothetical protein ACK5LS_11390 [Propioniciclava sp.]